MCLKSCRTFKDLQDWQSFLKIFESAINTTAMMDHHEHDPLMTSRSNMLRCATSHDLDSEKLILIKNGYLSPRTKALKN